MSIFTVYKRYPFAVPARVKFFNLFRLVFRFAIFEKLLISLMLNGQGRIWRKLIPPLYFYPQRSIRRAERDQINFVLDISKQLDHSIYFCTVGDTAWTNLLQTVSRDFSIIDVGANIGFLTLQFAKRSPQGTVYSLEPDSETFSRLTRNVNANGFKNIKLFRTAVGAHAGTAELFRMYESNPGANRILPAKPSVPVPSEIIEVVSLDELDSRGFFAKIDLIKIDVEGYELFVLEGARNLITRCQPILFVELVDQNLRLQGCTSASVIELLKQMNYVTLDARTMRVLMPSHEYYTDVICFPESRKGAYV